MTKLPILSSRQIASVLRAAGFEDAPKRGKGSHLAMVKRDPMGTRLVSSRGKKPYQGVLCVRFLNKLA